jgi:hypothetical protein
MFPLGFVFLFAVIAQKLQERFVPRVVLAFPVFPAVSLPYVVSLSKSKG